MGAPGAAFAAYLAQNKRLIDDFVLAHTPAPTHRTEQSEDLDRYLYGPVTRFVAGGGKRVRPALCLLGAEAVDADPATAMSVAASVELFQAAALIHDDIADKSMMRRGVPCLHVQEGVGLAINAGDSALVAVTTCVANDQSLTPAVRIRLLQELVSMQKRTLEGQALDLGWARDARWDVSASDYLAMARRKTAYYSCAVPLVLGAICGGGFHEQIEGLRRFGMDAGLAFQIKDDLLNLVGNAKAQGKDFRSDITEGKRTLVMMWALEHLEADEGDELVQILSAGTTDPIAMERAVELARGAGALDHANDYAHELVAQAKKELNAIELAQKPHELLISMADYFVERET